MKYTIDYGYGMAILYTPFEPKERFYTLASTCFGIRKSIMCCNIMKEEDVECDDFERLEFNGDVYVWDELGRRKCLEPEDMADEEWDDTYCEKCRYKKVEQVSNKVDITIITKPVEVAYKCPHCKTIIEMDYDDFESMMINEAPHWEHEEFCCDNCGEDIEVEDVEWN